MNINFMHNSNRRNFIKRFTGGLLGGTVLFNMTEKAGAAQIRDGNISIHSRDIFLKEMKEYSPTDEKFWKLIRNQFPLNKNRIYMNNGTMGPSPLYVQEAFSKKEAEVNFTGEYGGYEGTMERMAKFIGAEKEEIGLTHNVTDGINIIAQGIKIKAGDEVIITDHEHIGNAVPWFTRAKRDGIKIKVAKLGKNDNEVLNSINDAITKRTRVIAVPHLTCTQGQILPGKEISKLGHDKGLWVMLDGAHPPGMIPVNVKDLGCDYYATCGHKWMMAPKGTGFLYVKKDMLDTIEPFMTGGGAVEEWDYENGIKKWVNSGHRFFAGSQSAAIYVGLCAAADFLDDIGIENIAARGKALSNYFLKGLKEIPNVSILTPEDEHSRASITGFRLNNMEFGKFQSWLSEKYNMRIRGVGEGGLKSLRISLHIYNNFEEVDLLLKGIKEASKM